MKFEFSVITGPLGQYLQKNAPKILTAIGIATSAAAVATAVKSTRKLDAVLEEHKEALDTIKETPITEEYTEKDAKKDTAIVKGKCALDIAKLYAPTLILEGVSVGCFVGSHDILQRRNAALSAAALMTDQAFKDYRKRVADRFGEEVDKELKYKVVEREVSEEVTDKNGKTKTVKRKEKMVEASEHNDFTVIFDESSPYWEKNSEYNKSFIMSRIKMANQDLVRNYRLGKGGFYTINDWYDSIGVPRTKAGACAGWVYNPAYPEGHISMGIFDLSDPAKRDFINGYERSIILDPNYDTLDVFSAIGVKK